ncbi:MAG TPA: D-arabinono-1,4-lactone oxidase [Ktedonobacteraceae bacterium]|nr:D-arabinono-1,4-lactone oxidase [Ktedonobacteraceae bacterium]
MSNGKVGRWQNWSASVKSAPKEIVRPAGLEELARLIGAYSREGRHVRVVGAGHSFTPLVYSDDVLISLDKMQGIESVDAEKDRVAVWGGTRLRKLGDDLLVKGLAQENLGDIDVQSIAGAISTGTHGTGTRFGTISTQVVGLTLVTGNGEILECSEEKNPEIFKAAQTSFGVLGIIAKVTLRVVPARRLHYRGHRERLSKVLANLERYKQENSHFEFFWFPNTDWVQAKFINETEEPVSKTSFLGTLNKIVLENWVYWVLSEMCRLVPSFSTTASKISAAGVASIDEVNYSHRLFATPRMVRFQEMEYNLPAEHLPTVLQQVREIIKKEGINVHFPVECRFVKGDDIWLSPAYQRDSAYIAIHMYKGMPYAEYFRQAEAVYQNYQGRPHWGKMHTQDYRTFAQLYPRWNDFLRIRRRLDPQGVFLNDYLRAMLGVDVSEPVTDSQE